MKLGRLVQILSTIGLGKCKDILPYIYKVSSYEHFHKVLGLFGTNWEKLTILAWGDPAQRWLLKQGTDPMKYYYEGLYGYMDQLMT